MFLSEGYNFVGRGEGSTGWTGTDDRVGGAATPLDLMLGPLQNNGGPVPTMAPLSGSPLIDGGGDFADSGTQPAHLDGNGLPRTDGCHPDSGAYEVQNVDQLHRAVDHTNDSGPGSLRDALYCVLPGGTITFAPQVTGEIILTNSGLIVDKNVTLQEPGAGVLAISGGGAQRVFTVLGGTVSITALAIRDGRDFGASGADGLGGGFFNGDTLTLVDCAVVGNQARGGTGTNGLNTPDLRNGGDGGHGWGGGLYNTGVAALRDCTFGENLARGLNGGVGGGASTGGGPGGAAANSLGGAVLNDGVLTVLNCTFATNRVVAGAGGTGGLFDGLGGRGGNGDGGSLYNRGTNYLVNVTVVGGTTAGGLGGTGLTVGAAGLARGGGVFAGLSSTFFLTTLRAHNSAANDGPDVFGTGTSVGHNLLNGTNGSSGWTNSDLLGAMPLLQPLANYGGPALTLLPLSGSPAFNAGDDAVLAAPWSLATDQRGGARRAGNHGDSGAIEVGSRLRITEIRKAGNQFDLSFTTELGWPHFLQSKDALAPALPWGTVPNSFVTGNGNGVTVPDTRPRSSTTRLYRAVMAP